MCLLLVLSRLHPDLPLVVGANRDEQLDRPAVPMAVLHEAGPRILGGRDEQAGGTWLAVNEHGVVAGLTNRPLLDGPATGKRSRGELPLALAGRTTAAAAVEDFERRFRPADYNPSWLIVGDRTDLFGIDMTGDHVGVVQLDPGIHVLENRPLGAASPKAAHVRSLVEGAADLDPDALVARLQAVLADHTIPPGPSAGAEAGRKDVPPEVGAACVHTARYGTRWSCVVTVDDDPGRAPGVVYADGPACGGGFRDAGPMWSGGQPR